MDRRGFLSAILKGGIAAAILPSALTYTRNWITQGSLIIPESEISTAAFTQFLIDQQPFYDKAILASLNPMDGWVGHMTAGQFPTFTGDAVFTERFADIYPDMRSVGWERADNLGAPLNIHRSPLDKIRDAWNNFADKLTIS